MSIEKTKTDSVGGHAAPILDDGRLIPRLLEELRRIQPEVAYDVRIFRATRLSTITVMRDNKEPWTWELPMYREGRWYLTAEEFLRAEIVRFSQHI